MRDVETLIADPCGDVGRRSLTSFEVAHRERDVRARRRQLPGVSTPMPDLAPVIVARLPVRSTPASTSSGVESLVNRVVMRICDGMVVQFPTCTPASHERSFDAAPGRLVVSTSMASSIARALDRQTECVPTFVGYAA